VRSEALRMVEGFSSIAIESPNPTRREGVGRTIGLVAKVQQWRSVRTIPDVV